MGACRTPTTPSVSNPPHKEPCRNGACQSKTCINSPKHIPKANSSKEEREMYDLATD